MTAPEDTHATWLPNLVGGVSIWTLASDLNEPQFFDGRLLVPETEGAASLPVSVRWDLTNLVPLAEARTRYPEDVARAVADFEAALGRVAKVFATAGSGYDRYKDAFTVPSLEGGGASNYYYSPASKKLSVVNWGASPRNVGGRAEYVFGWQDWGSVLRVGAVAGASAAATIGVDAPTAAAADGDAGARARESAGEDTSKPDGKPNDEKRRPWWMLPLFVLAALAVLLLAFFILRSCEDDAGRHAADAADAGSDAAIDAADATDASSSAEADAESSGDAASDAEAEADASADASEADATSEAGADASADAGKTDEDGGQSASNGGDDDDDAPGTGGGGGGGGGGGPGGGVVVVQGHAGGADGKTEAQVKSGPHRRHYQDGAVGWRVADGIDRVARTEQRGQRFDVWLGPNMTFQNVRVQWQDKSGQWHDH